jgi:hypothetical protein
MSLSLYFILLLNLFLFYFINSCVGRTCLRVPNTNEFKCIIILKGHQCDPQDDNCDDGLYCSKNYNEPNIPENYKCVECKREGAFCNNGECCNDLPCNYKGFCGIIYY